MEEKELSKELPTELSKEIVFSSNEAQALLVIIDIALKSRGLELAETALYLTNKIQKSFNES